ncbi:hypothetical protein FRC11_014969, partial [Ceratobasidium sp. 423]
TIDYESLFGFEKDWCVNFAYDANVALLRPRIDSTEDFIAKKPCIGPGTDFDFLVDKKPDPKLGSGTTKTKKVTFARSARKRKCPSDLAEYYARGETSGNGLSFGVFNPKRDRMENLVKLPVVELTKSWGTKLQGYKNRLRGVRIRNPRTPLPPGTYPSISNNMGVSECTTYELKKTIQFIAVSHAANQLLKGEKVAGIRTTYYTVEHYFPGNNGYREFADGTPTPDFGFIVNAVIHDKIKGILLAEANGVPPKLVGLQDKYAMFGLGGESDYSVRYLLNFLWRNYGHKIPFGIVGDLNASGKEIALTLIRGSRATVHENIRMVVPSLAPVGLTMDDLEIMMEHGGPAAGERLSKDPRTPENWREEIDSMLTTGIAMESESVPSPRLVAHTHSRMHSLWQELVSKSPPPADSSNVMYQEFGPLVADVSDQIEVARLQVDDGELGNRHFRFYSGDGIIGNREFTLHPDGAVTINYYGLKKHMTAHELIECSTKDEITSLGDAWRMIVEMLGSSNYRKHASATIKLFADLANLLRSNHGPVSFYDCAYAQLVAKFLLTTTISGCPNPDCTSVCKDKQALKQHLSRAKGCRCARIVSIIPPGDGCDTTRYQCVYPDCDARGPYTSLKAWEDHYVPAHTELRGCPNPGGRCLNRDCIVECPKKSTLKRHPSTILPDDNCDTTRYECAYPNCDARGPYTSLEAWDDHYMSAHAAFGECLNPNCSVECPSKSALKRHLSTRHGYECTLEASTIPPDGDYNTTRYECAYPDCNAQGPYGMLETWEDHYISAHAAFVECPNSDCPRVYKNKEALKIHLWNDDGYQCALAASTIPPGSECDTTRYRCVYPGCDAQGPYTSLEAWDDHYVPAHTALGGCPHPGGGCVNPECNTVCPTKFTVKQHLSNPTGYKCALIASTISPDDEYDATRYECAYPDCDAQGPYETLKVWDEHYMSAHAALGGCVNPDCTVACPNMYALKRHLSNHSGYNCALVVSTIPPDDGCDTVRYKCAYPDCDAQGPYETLKAWGDHYQLAHTHKGCVNPDCTNLCPNMHFLKRHLSNPTGYKCALIASTIPPDDGCGTTRYECAYPDCDAQGPYETLEVWDEHYMSAHAALGGCVNPDCTVACLDKSILKRHLSNHSGYNCALVASTIPPGDGCDTARYKCAYPDCDAQGPYETLKAWDDHYQLAHAHKGCVNPDCTNVCPDKHVLKRHLSGRNGYKCILAASTILPDSDRDTARYKCAYPDCDAKGPYKTLQAWDDHYISAHAALGGCSNSGGCLNPDCTNLCPDMFVLKRHLSNRSGYNCALVASTIPPDDGCNTARYKCAYPDCDAQGPYETLKAWDDHYQLAHAQKGCVNPDCTTPCLKKSVLKYHLSNRNGYNCALVASTIPPGDGCDTVRYKCAYPDCDAQGPYETLKAWDDHYQLAHTHEGCVNPDCTNLCPNMHVLKHHLSGRNGYKCTLAASTILPDSDRDTARYKCAYPDCDAQGPYKTLQAWDEHYMSAHAAFEGPPKGAAGCVNPDCTTPCKDKVALGRHLSTSKGYNCAWMTSTTRPTGAPLGDPNTTRHWCVHPKCYALEPFTTHKDWKSHYLPAHLKPKLHHLVVHDGNQTEEMELDDRGAQVAAVEDTSVEEAGPPAKKRKTSKAGQPTTGTRAKPKSTKSRVTKK